MTRTCIALTSARVRNQNFILLYRRIGFGGALLGGGSSLSWSSSQSENGSFVDGLADYKSAIQQVANLRYEAEVKGCARDGR